MSRVSPYAYQNSYNSSPWEGIPKIDIAILSIKTKWADIPHWQISILPIYPEIAGIPI